MMSEEFNIEDAIHELGVLLADEQTGLMVTTMQQDFYEKYERFELETAWECFVSEINRVEKAIQLHDFLAIHIEELKKIGETE